MYIELINRGKQDEEISVRFQKLTGDYRGLLQFLYWLDVEDEEASQVVQGFISYVELTLAGQDPAKVNTQ